MSRTLSQNWIVKFFQTSLDKNPPNRLESRQKVVQVVSVNQELRSINVADREVEVQVFLSTQAFEKLQPIEDLTHSMVRLSKFSATLVPHIVWNRDADKLVEQSASWPLAILCADVLKLGAGEFERVGSPERLRNKVNYWHTLVQGLSYQDMNTRLVMNQFPKMGCLPDQGE